MSVLEYIPWPRVSAGIPAASPLSSMGQWMTVMSTMPLNCAAAPQVRLLSVNSWPGNSSVPRLKSIFTPDLRSVCPNRYESVNRLAPTPWTTGDWCFQKEGWMPERSRARNSGKGGWRPPQARTMTVVRILCSLSSLSRRTVWGHSFPLPFPPFLKWNCGFRPVPWSLWNF